MYTVGAGSSPAGSDAAAPAADASAAAAGDGGAKNEDDGSAVSCALIEEGSGWITVPNARTTRGFEAPAVLSPGMLLRAGSAAAPSTPESSDSSATGFL